MEQRRYVRLSVTMDVWLVQSYMPAMMCTTQNIGPGGMFLRADPLIHPRNSPIQVEFSTTAVNGEKSTYRIPATVSYSTSEGLGLCFAQSDDSEHHLSRMLLGMLCAETCSDEQLHLAS
jgi:hypothetical protein